MRVCRLLSHFGGFLKWRLPPNPPNKSTILSTFQPMVFHQKWYSYLQIPLFTIICIIDIAHILEISSYFPMKSRFMKLMSSFSPPFSHIFLPYFPMFFPGKGAQKWAENPKLWEKVNPPSRALVRKIPCP